MLLFTVNCGPGESKELIDCNCFGGGGNNDFSYSIYDCSKPANKEKYYVITATSDFDSTAFKRISGIDCVENTFFHPIMPNQLSFQIPNTCNNTRYVTRQVQGFMTWHFIK